MTFCPMRSSKKSTRQEAIISCPLRPSLVALLRNTCSRALPKRMSLCITFLLTMLKITREWRCNWCEAWGYSVKTFKLHMFYRGFPQFWNKTSVVHLIQNIICLYNLYYKLVLYYICKQYCCCWFRYVMILVQPPHWWPKNNRWIRIWLEFETFAAFYEYMLSHVRQWPTFHSVVALERYIESKR